jgi:hypothetical protein
MEAAIDEDSLFDVLAELANWFDEHDAFDEFTNLHQVARKKMGVDVLPDAESFLTN